MTESLFRTEGTKFVPADAAGNPWGANLTGGGPVAGLLAHALEAALTDSDLFVARLTADLMRPVPRTELDVTTRVLRAGKRLHVLEATLSAQGQDLARMTAQAVRREEIAEPSPPLGVPFAGPDELEDGTLLPQGLGLLPGVHDVVQTRWITDQFSNEPTCRVWMRMPMTLLPGVPTSPLVHVAILSDCINAASPIGRLAGPWINTDITLYLHRELEGDWLGIESTRATEHTGVGLASATLYDYKGPLGTVSEAILVNQLG